MPLSEEELEQQDLDRAEKAEEAKVDREKARADKDAKGESDDGAPPAPPRCSLRPIWGARWPQQSLSAAISGSRMHSRCVGN